MTQLRIILGTPANAGVVTLGYLNSLLKLQEFLLRRGSQLEVRQSASMFLPKARNVMASIFHERKELTHLLFVDSDMGFRPQLIERMVQFDKPIVGVIAPHRFINFNKVAEAARRTTDPQKLENLSATYTTTAIVKNADGSVNVDRGFVEVTQLGTGILLINRVAIDMIAQWPGIIAADHSALTASKKMIQCFAPLNDESGLMLSEDISFSRRWTLNGGRFWACIDEEIIHTGQQDVRGRYFDHLTS